MNSIEEYERIELEYNKAKSEYDKTISEYNKIKLEYDNTISKYDKSISDDDQIFLISDIENDDIDVNEITIKEHCLYYSGFIINIKFQTTIFINLTQHKNKDTLFFYIETTPILKKIQSRFATEYDYVDLIFSPNTTLSNNKGKCYAELGLDFDGTPATYLLPYLQPNFDCSVKVDLTIKDNYLYCNVIDIQNID